MTLTPKLWAMLGTGILIAILLIALFATRATLAGVKGERDVANAKLAVSNASIGRLTASLDAIKAQQVSLATDDAKRIQASREALKLAEAASAVRQAAIDRLNQSAAVLRPEPVAAPEACQFSTAALEEWK